MALEGVPRYVSIGKIQNRMSMASLAVYAGDLLLYTIKNRFIETQVGSLNMRTGGGKNIYIV